jgi:hypothetical protein
VQLCNSIRLGYVEGLDLDTTLIVVGQLVKLGSGAAAYRANDVPSSRQELGRHGEAKTA